MFLSVSFHAVANMVAYLSLAFNLDELKYFGFLLCIRYVHTESPCLYAVDLVAVVLEKAIMRGLLLFLGTYFLKFHKNGF